MVLIKFDDIIGYPLTEDNSIPNGYAGLNWNSFGVINAINYPINPSGYSNGIISSPNDTYNDFGNPCSITALTTNDTFNLNSGYFTAAWNNNLNLNVIAYDVSNNILYQNNYTLQTSAPLLITFNWTNIYQVTFNSSGGTNAGLNSNGTYFCT
jgi:hypothetical protein